MKFLIFSVICVCSIFNSNFCHVEGSIIVNKITGKQLSPVIFVPGDGGSQMDAKLNKPSVVHYICDKTTKDWFNIWLNLELLVPLVIDCWVDNTRLVYDNVTRTTSNSPGVESRNPGWGNPEVVEWLDPSHAKQGSYFKDIGNALVKQGYVRNISIRGAPYDFRKAPNENKQWFIDLKTLIEETYEMNDKTPISFVAHSMGAMMCTTFLQQQPDSWKDKYIARMITIAGAYGGSAKAVKVFAVGDDLGAWILRPKIMRLAQMTFPSLSWLLPSPYFWKPDEVLIKTRVRNYTYSQMEDFFKDIDYYTGWEMRKDTLQYVQNFNAPNVEIHCIYSTGLPTVESLDYQKSDYIDGDPTIKTGEGDGTVNIRSLLGCTYWQKVQKQPIFTYEIKNAEHLQILGHPTAVEKVLKALKLVN